MRKVIGLTIAVVLIIGLIAGGTWAYFTDTETTGPITFTAGIIDLELTAGDTVVADGTLTDLKPCQTGLIVIMLTAAEGSNPMHVWKHIVDVDPADRDENGVTDAEGKYYTDHGIDPGTGKNDIDRYIHFDMWIDNDGDTTSFNDDTGNSETDDVMLIPESDGWLLSRNLADFPAVAGTDPPTNGVSCFWIYLGILDPAGVEGSASMTIVQSFHMDATVDNWAQSDILTFTEEFFALQTVGTPTPPIPELPGEESGL